MNLEHELQHALERKSPSSGFDERVLRRIASGGTIQAPPPPPARWARRALPVAASLVLAIGGSYYVQQQRHKQAQAEQAARDVVLALRIASEKVSAVQVKVQEISHHERQIDY